MNKLLFVIAGLVLLLVLVQFLTPATKNTPAPVPSNACIIQVNGSNNCHY